MVDLDKISIQVLLSHMFSDGISERGKGGSFKECLKLLNGLFGWRSGETDSFNANQGHSLPESEGNYNPSRKRPEAH